MGIGFIRACNEQLAMVASQRIRANQRQCALGVAPTIGSQVVPLNV